jgi:hypothetical protein
MESFGGLGFVRELLLLFLLFNPKKGDKTPSLTSLVSSRTAIFEKKLPTDNNYQSSFNYRKSPHANQRNTTPEETSIK